jgi:hypothetical protein
VRKILDNTEESLLRALAAAMDQRGVAGEATRSRIGQPHTLDIAGFFRAL